uniref:Syntaxin-8 n=1 Tax=Accipiter nisus TaxID=211598 RepID=A0A8B9N8M4_9AVES
CTHAPGTHTPCTHAPLHHSPRPTPPHPTPPHLSRPVPSRPVPFPSLPFPSLPFPSLPFPSLPFPSLPFPSLPSTLRLRTAGFGPPRAPSSADPSRKRGGSSGRRRPWLRTPGSRCTVPPARSPRRSRRKSRSVTAAKGTGRVRPSTQLEGDRRQNLVDDLLTRQKQLQASYKNEGTEPDVIRSSLMTGGVKRGVTNPWLLEESEETRGLGFDDLRQQQRRIIEEQDAGLDALSSIISRQKQMGQEIGNELDEQNEIIDDLTNLVENTDDKLRNQTRHVKLVDKKSTSCGRKWLEHNPVIK